MDFNVVDFPAPFAPIRLTICPLSTLIETEETASRRPYLTDMSSTLSMPAPAAQIGLYDALIIQHPIRGPFGNRSALGNNDDL